MVDNPMFATTVNFFNLLLAALIVGVMFCIWLTSNPSGMSAADYVTMQHRYISTLNVFLPRLGMAIILLTMVAAVLARGDPTRVSLLVVAALCMVGAGLVTRFLNQPINAIVMTWSLDAPPAEWKQLADDWWRWHIVRLVVGATGLCLLILAALKRV
jgi:uncharacterized membrane protein